MISCTFFPSIFFCSTSLRFSNSFINGASEKIQTPALVVIKLQAQQNYQVLIDNMKRYNINYTAINKNDNVFAYLV